MVIQIMRGTKGLFALDSNGHIFFRKFRENGGDGTWSRVRNPGVTFGKVVQILLGSDGLFALLHNGTIMRRPFGRSHRFEWRTYKGPTC